MKTKFFTLFLSLFASSAISAQCLVQAIAQPTGCGTPCTGSVNAFGNGTPPLAYVWMPGNYTNQNVSGLCAGTYTVTMTDGSGCVATATASVTSSSTLQTVGTSQPSSACNPCNGLGIVTVFGGTPPYTYSWAPSGGTQPTATGLCAGTYTMTATDAGGCTTSTTVTITQINGPVAFAQCSPTTCGQFTGSSMVNVTGGTPPYSYSWAPSGQTSQTATGLSTGCYTVTVTDAGGCTVTASCCVTTSNAPTVTVINPVPSNCPACTGSATAIATGGQSPYTFMWNTVPSQLTPTATGLCQGTYTVCVTDANGCTACTSVNISCVVGLTDEPLQAEVNIFPNPAEDEISISLDQELANVSVVIYNIVGEVIGSSKFNFAVGKKFKMDISQLSEGIYFIELRKGNMTIKKKFVKN